MLIRYPGSKDRHANFLLDHIPIGVNICEPFCGTAGITFAHILRGGEPRVWLNDLDHGMSSLWGTVMETPDKLCRLVQMFQPDAAAFYEYKEFSPEEDLHAAFRKIVLHQTSYSGLGEKAGSPIGGREQLGKYKVDCRWNAKRLTTGICEASRMLEPSRTTITNLTWEHVINKAIHEGYFMYLDPPYFTEGAGLYKYGTIDHVWLAKKLRDNPSGWAMSYDGCSKIIELYEGWCDIIPVPVTSHLKHKKIMDILIKPRVE